MSESLLSTLQATILSFAIVGIVLSAFIFGLRQGVMAILLVRCVCDLVFDLSKISLGDNDISMGAALNVVVIAAAVISLALYPQRTAIKYSLIWGPFLAVACFTTVLAPDPIMAIRKLLVLVSYWAMFILPFFLVRSRTDLEQFLKVILLSSVYPVLYGLFEAVTGAGGVHEMGEFRVQSTFPHPNIFAFYLIFMISIILYARVSNNVFFSQGLQRILSIYILPLLFLLIMTKTRSAWLACVMIFAIYGILYDRRVIVMLLFMLPLATLVPAIYERLSDLEAGNVYIGTPTALNSFAWRSLLWQMTLAKWREAPWLGYGLNSFNYYSGSFFVLAPKGTFAHNVYVQLLFETGIAGLVVYLWLFARLMWSVASRLKWDRHGSIMILTVICAYLMVSYSDNMLDYLAANWYFWFYLGAASAVAYVHEALPLSARQMSDPKPKYLRARVTAKVGFHMNSVQHRTHKL